MTAPTPITVNNLDALAGLPGQVFNDPAGVAMDAVNGNSYPNSGMTLLRVQNTDTQPHNLTIVPAINVDGIALQNDVRIVPASGTIWVPRLETNAYGTVVNVTGPATLKLTAFEP